MRKGRLSAVAALAGILGGVVAIGLLACLRACHVVLELSPIEHRIARHFAALARRDAR